MTEMNKEALNLKCFPLLSVLLDVRSSMSHDHELPSSFFVHLGITAMIRSQVLEHFQQGEIVLRTPLKTDLFSSSRPPARGQRWRLRPDLVIFFVAGYVSKLLLVNLLMLVLSSPNLP